LPRNLPLGVFWMSTGSAAVMELAASAAPDAIVIDAQHGLWDRQTLEHAVGLVSTACRCWCAPRTQARSRSARRSTPAPKASSIPLIETDTQAAAAVRAARFPPHGARSGGGVRNRWRTTRALLRGRERPHRGRRDDRTQRGVHNAAAIANTKGIDFVLIGTGDLAISLGGFPNVDARHEQACKTVNDACKQGRRRAVAFSPCRPRPPRSAATRAMRS
jgi:2-keto-3-deoxy-L-rhamnonate aldolase RhmA